MIFFRDEDPDEALVTKKEKLCRLSTEKKMRKKHLKMIKEITDSILKSKPQYKDMPPLLPISIPDVS